VESVGLPVPLRRPARAAVVLAMLGFVALAVRYAGDSTAGRFDDRVRSALDATVSGRSPLNLLLSLGEPLPVGASALVLALVALSLRRRRLALLAVVGPVLTGLVTTFVKPLDGRVIGGGSFSFPSGHTGGACSLGLVTALLLVSVLGLGSVASIAVLVLGTLLPGAAMAVGLIVNDWHYATDTVGGLCAAVTMVLGSALVIEHVADRRAATPVSG
jgi:undecaprenyl-diphosphatase